MYDQSYNLSTLTDVLRKGDFRNIPKASQEAFKKATLAAAQVSASTIFNGTNPIAVFHLKKKTAYRIKKLADDLVVRKLSANLKRIDKTKSRGRSFLISTLFRFLEEGVPYRIYRLDIKSFYESFLIADIKEKTLNLNWLTPLSKRHHEALFDYFEILGGQGVPRGMAISAVLSDGLMSRFDKAALAHPAVYFYGRYVDDIIIISNLTETPNGFLAEIANLLPTGLQLNKKKQQIHTLSDKAGYVLPPVTMPDLKFCFEYLGYQYLVFDPLIASKKECTGFRLVQVEIAPIKVEKIKKKIVRSFLDFRKTGNESLLIERVSYLTSNFSVTDRNSGKRKLSGIFHSYPMLSDDSESLFELDKFLRNAIFSKKGRLFSKTAPLMSSSLKRKLASMSFTTGHKTRRFVYFSSTTINRIQECWIHE